MLTNYQKYLIKHVQQSITNAELGISKLDNSILELEGMSGNKVRHFLNNICSLEHAKYLEIGIWKGSTFISGLYQNNLSQAIAIDNWSEFFGPKQEFEQNATKFLRPNSYQFYESDCFALDLQTIPDTINIYFYDASHTKDNQKKAFTHYNAIFDDTFIAIVDNYNWLQVQDGVQTAFKELQYTILFEQFLSSPKKRDKLGWWTGVYIAVINKS